MNKGKFITVEGVEGVGKSTNLAFISEKIVSLGYEVVQTREPGGTPLAEELRELLLAERSEPVDPTAELLTVFAARSQHLREVILPALDRGAWVVCDRFTDATYAYQGYGRGLPLDNIAQLESLVQGAFQPHATFYLDIDVSIGLERARRRAALDRFETEQLAFFEKVKQGYWERIRLNPERFHVVDASQSLEAVQSDIADKLEVFMSGLRVNTP